MKHFFFLNLSSLIAIKKSTHEIVQSTLNANKFQGHDTTAAGSSFVLCLLGIHKDIQAKVYNELYEIFGDSDRPATFADTLEMKYLERVILEALRMYPPVPAIARKLNNDVKIGKNCSLLQRQSIFYNIFFCFCIMYYLICCFPSLSALAAIDLSPSFDLGSVRELATDISFVFSNFRIILQTNEHSLLLG